MNGFPETEEAVALELWNRIREAEAQGQAERGRNIPHRADLIALYAQCLSAVKGIHDTPPSGYIN